jgi:hypothetical protein
VKQVLWRLGRLVLIIAAVGAAIKVMGPKISAAMEDKFENAPDDFPPKWMFLNITAIRDNTERILRLLEDEPSDAEAA